MALTLGTTYNDDYGRIQISISGANTDADYARVEHSLDQITWTTIRGGDTVPLVAGAGHIDHYDGYVFGVTNYYRVTAVDSGLLPSFIASGTAVTGNNTSLVPVAPAGLAVGDLKLIAASIRNSGAGTVNTPAGWTKVAESGNEALLARIHQGGDTPPTVTFSGGVANADTLVQMACFRNAKLTPNDIAGQLNLTDQNVLFPNITLKGPGMIIYLGWKQDDMTSSTTPTFAVKIGDVSSTTGDDAAMFWYFFGNPASNYGLSFGGSPVLVTGGATAISRALSVQFPVIDFTDQGTTSYTPVLPNKYRKPYWLMNPGRPGQNVRIECTEISDIGNSGRTGVFDVLGRSFPIVVSDVMGSDELTLSIDAATKQEVKDLAARLALGEPMYLLVADPLDDLDTMYFTVTSMARRRDAVRSSWTLDITVRETAQPAPTVYGLTYVWSDVTSDYATWADVVAANTSWSNLVDKISDDVIIVP